MYHKIVSLKQNSLNPIPEGFPYFFLNVPSDLLSKIGQYLAPQELSVFALSSFECGKPNLFYNTWAMVMPTTCPKQAERLVDVAPAFFFRSVTNRHMTYFHSQFDEFLASFGASHPFVRSMFLSDRVPLSIKGKIVSDASFKKDFFENSVDFHPVLEALVNTSEFVQEQKYSLVTHESVIRTIAREMPYLFTNILASFGTVEEGKSYLNLVKEKTKYLGFNFEKSVGVTGLSVKLSAHVRILWKKPTVSRLMNPTASSAKKVVKKL